MTPGQDQIQAALALRYGKAGTNPTLPWNDTIATLLEHRSVRAYTAEPLAEGTIEAMVAAAQSASTSSNLQMWSVLAVEDAARKGRLSELTGGQKHVREAPLFLVFLIDHARLRDAAASHGTATEGLDFLETFLVGAVDAALAAQNAAVAAESMGLGTVYVGAIRNEPEAIAETLRLPPHVMALFGLCVGHPDPARPTAVKPRLPQRQVLHRETFSEQPRENDLAAYDATLREFQVKQGMPAADWSAFTTRRVATGAALRGRERLRAAAAALGFAIR